MPAGGTGNVVFSKASRRMVNWLRSRWWSRSTPGRSHGTVINNSATAASSIPDPMARTTPEWPRRPLTRLLADVSRTAVLRRSTRRPRRRARSPRAGVVTYATPTASDNCSATVACVPPSGSMFPVGTTTVTCTATDTAGNTATCSFPVTVFTLCLQDNSNPGNVVLIDSSTGAYRFCCNGVLVASGTGTSNRQRLHGQHQRFEQQQDSADHGGRCGDEGNRIS